MPNRRHRTPRPGKHAVDEQLLLDVARYYYEERLTQHEISLRIKASRSTVSRLLQEALDKHVVTITINHPWPRLRELEQRLIAKFRLRDARVFDGNERDEDEIMEGMGVLAASLIDAHVKDGHVLGISYGRGVARTVAALSPSRRLAVTVVPVIGALGAENTSIDGPELVRKFAQAYGGEFRYLPGPLLVKDERTRDALMRLPQICETLAIAKKSNLVLIGIGAPSKSSLIWSGYLDKRGLEWITNQGAAGHMCGQFFDSDGQVLDIDPNRRSIGIGIKALRSIDVVVAVAGGEAKAQAILGALRGRYLNVLVTDGAAASAILDLEEQRAVK